MEIKGVSFVWLWILVGVLTFAGCALEYYPVQVVFVQPGVPTPVVLAVGTPEELETLVFIIVEQPKFGVLLGFPPELVYIPHEGFTGLDWFSFLVQTRDGRLLEYGTVRLRVIAPEPVVSPSFRSRGTVTFSGLPLTLKTYRFELGLDALFQYLITRMDAILDHTGFSGFRAFAQVEFEGDRPVPWRLPIFSTLTFSPPPTLASWTVSARTTILGWDLSWFFYYSGTDPQTRSYTTFTIRGSVDRYHLSSRIRFDTLTPTFAEKELTLRGPWLCGDCPIKWDLKFIQKKEGFDHLSFTIREIPIPCPACEPFRLYLDTEIKFTTKEKTVAPRFRLWPVPLCVRPLVELVTLPVGFGIDGLHLYGLEIRCDLPKGYRTLFRISFDPARDSRVTGDPRFFAVMWVEGSVIPCCGWLGWWRLSGFFTRRADQLMGFGMMDASIYFPISHEVILDMRATLDLIDPAKTKFTLGWRGMF